jgi:hypothetical protein
MFYILFNILYIFRGPNDVGNSNAGEEADEEALMPLA